MKNTLRIAVLGGDARQAYAAEWLSSNGCTVSVWGLSEEVEGVEVCDEAEAAVSGATLLLLPIPLSRDRLQLNRTSLSLSSLMSWLHPGMSVFCGMPPAEWVCEAERKGITVIDYSRDEIFMLRNALPTAEGAVAIAMNELRRTLYGSRVMVIGYGRIGKLLSALLLRMGAHVTVSARKSLDLASAELQGCRAWRLTPKTDGEGFFLPVPSEQYHVLFNTVPSPVIGEDVLAALRRDTVLIDLASAPGGIDYEAASRLGLRTVVALSLPGKVAPMTAGEIIADCVLRYGREEGNRQ